MSYNLLLGRPWIHANWIVPSTLHPCFKYVGNDAVVWTVFVEVQLFRGVENYITNSLLYQEDIEPLKQSLPDDIDSDNEADSESEEEAPATISVEPIVEYLDDFECNNPAENEGEGVHNENIAFDILCVLRMYLSMLGPYTCLYQS